MLLQAWVLIGRGGCMVQGMLIMELRVLVGFGVLIGQGGFLLGRGVIMMRGVFQAGVLMVRLGLMSRGGLIGCWGLPRGVLLGGQGGRLFV